MKWQRTLLSLVLMGGCIWCVALVQRVHSEEKAAGAAETPAYRPVAPAGTLIKAQEEHLEEVRKQAAASSPSLKKLAEHAFVAAEFFNLLQYYKELPEGTPSPAQGREAAMAVGKAARDKNIDQARAQAARLEKLPAAGKDAPPPGAPAEPYTPVASVHDLMEVQQDHFDAVRKELRNAEPDFDKVVASILVVAELSNVNQYQNDKPDYRTWAAETRDISVQLSRAAREKDLSAARDISRQVHANCTKCHDKYQ